MPRAGIAGLGVWGIFFWSRGWQDGRYGVSLKTWTYQDDEKRQVGAHFNHCSVITDFVTGLDELETLNFGSIWRCEGMKTSTKIENYSDFL
jgi:hypothetical protein